MLSPERISELLESFAPRVPNALAEKLGIYLDLLLKWNARTNLTAVRSPEEIVQRHFGESLFASAVLAEKLGSGVKVLDFGSGAGFPGVPIALAQPGWKVTLAESQGKKAAFLREVKRSLALGNAEVWGERADRLPENTAFSAVILRAVDDPDRALSEAANFVAPGGWLAHMHGGVVEAGWDSRLLPESSDRWISLRAVDVPRGTNMRPSASTT